MKICKLNNLIYCHTWKYVSRITNIRYGFYGDNFYWKRDILYFIIQLKLSTENSIYLDTKDQKLDQNQPTLTNSNSNQIQTQNVNSNLRRVVKRSKLPTIRQLNPETNRQNSCFRIIGDFQRELLIGPDFSRRLFFYCTHLFCSTFITSFPLVFFSCHQN